MNPQESQITQSWLLAWEQVLKRGTGLNPEANSCPYPAHPSDARRCTRTAWGGLGIKASLQIKLFISHIHPQGSLFLPLIWECSAILVAARFPRKVGSGLLQLTLHISLISLGILTLICFRTTGQITRKGGKAQFIGNIVPLALIVPHRHDPTVPLLCVPLFAGLDGKNL